MFCDRTRFTFLIVVIICWFNRYTKINVNLKEDFKIKSSPNPALLFLSLLSSNREKGLSVYYIDMVH